MKDRYFYPLAIMVVAAIIFFALKPAERVAPLTDEQIAAQGFTLEGLELERLTASPGTVISFKDDALEKIKYARLSTNTPREMATPSAGVFATLGAQYERVFAGKPLLIEVEARANALAPLDEFDMGYFTAETGDTGWIRYSLSDKFETYTLSFTPKAGKTPANDYFGIWPGEHGNGDIMDVRAMRVRINTKKMNDDQE